MAQRKQKKLTLQDRFPLTRRGLEDARDELTDLQNRYDEKWKEFNQRLAFLKLGTEMMIAKQSLTHLQADIIKLKAHLQKIKDALVDEDEVTLFGVLG